MNNSEFNLLFWIVWVDVLVIDKSHLIDQHQNIVQAGKYSLSCSFPSKIQTWFFSESDDSDEGYWTQLSWFHLFFTPWILFFPTFSSILLHDIIYWKFTDEKEASRSNVEFVPLLIYQHVLWLHFLVHLFKYLIDWFFFFSNPQMGGNTIDELLSRGDSETFLQQSGDSINGKSVVNYCFFNRFEYLIDLGIIMFLI